MNKNKKILFMLHLPPPVHGSSIVGQKLKDSELINHSFQTKYINLLISRIVNESGKTNLSKLIRFSVSWFKLLLELIKVRPNLCYFALTTTGSAFYKDVTLIFLLKAFGVITVFHLHNKGIKKKENSKINNFMYRFVFNKSYVILLSNYLYDDIKTFVSMDRTYICPNGVEDIGIKSINKLEYVSKPIKILFLSNLIKSKGVFVLIDACEILKRKGYNFSCDFVGGEGDVSAYQFNEEVEKRGLKENARYLGRKYGEDKNIVYKGSDVFVLPTSNDCFPLVILEAMQYELPIISTIEGGIRDIVENNVNGFIVERNNPIDLANKLEVLINSKALRLEMGKAGRAKYEKEFTLQAFETKLQEILESVLLKYTDRNDKK